MARDHNPHKYRPPANVRGYRAHKYKLIKWQYFGPLLLAIIFIIPLLKYGPRTGMLIIGLLFLTLLSRSNTIYDRLWIELHSVLLLCIANVFGISIAVFIVLAQTPLIFIVAPRTGVALNPGLVLIDMPYLLALCIIGGLVSPGDLLFYGMATMIILNYVPLNLARTIVSPEPLIKKFSMSMINGVVNYTLLSDFAPVLVAYLSSV